MTCCLLNYLHFKENHKLIPLDLSNQEALEYDQQVIKRINFNANQDSEGNTKMVFILGRSKRSCFGFL